MSELDKFFTHAALLFLVTGGVSGLLMGAALILRPDWLVRISEVTDTWVATRKVSSALERVFRIDHWLYRHHRLSGGLLLAGAVFLMYFFSARFDKAPIMLSFAIRYSIPPVFTEILVDSAVLSILLGAAFTLLISLFLLHRPSMLKNFEQRANRWISLRQALKPLESLRSGVDDYAFQNAQMTGVLLLAGSLYVLVVLTAWL